MKNLYLIRHAKSSWKEPHISDYERPLNKRGLHDAPLMADKVTKVYPSPDRIFSSGAKRAALTTDHFISSWELDKQAYHIEKELYLCSFSLLEQFALNLFEKYNTIAIVAHNPSIENFLTINCNFKEGKFPTCGFAKVSYNNGDWNLDAFHYPKLYY